MSAVDKNDPSTASDDAACAWAYDSLGRTVAETLQIGSGTKRIVTASQTSLRRAYLVYPNDRQVNYAYHTGGALLSLTDDGAGTAITSYHYIGGRTLKRTMQNGVNLDLTTGTLTQYDTSGQPTRWIHTGTNPGSSPTSLDFRYNYDSAGNKLFQRPAHDGRDAQRYSYDSSGRVTGFSRGDFNPAGLTRDSAAYCDAPTTATWGGMAQALKWKLDGVGNWSQLDVRKSGATFTETRTDNTFNAYAVITGPGGSATLVHDPNGNLTSTGTLQLKWDALNRLREARNGGGSLIATYLFDADNRRVRKTLAGGAATDYLYDGWRVLEERNGSTGAVQRQFVYGNYLDEALVMDVDTDADGSCIDAGGSARYFYHQNTLYSVCAVTDSTGKIVEAYEYDPYGRHVLLRDGNSDGRVNFNSTDIRLAMGASAIGNPNTFTGQRFDPETGLHYCKERYYSCTQGRFISRDPIGYEGGKNLYAAYFVPGGMDPLGLWRMDFHLSLTTTLGLMAGINCAGVLGFYADSPDRDESSPPDAAWNALFLQLAATRGGETAEQAARVDALRAEASRLLARAAEWHFPVSSDGKVNPGSTEARAKVEAVLKSKTCDLKQFGRALHPLQDSWSHQGKPYIFGVGHGRGAEQGPPRLVRVGGMGKIYFPGQWRKLEDLEAALSPSADDMALWHADVRKAAMETYTYIEKFKRKCPCACPPNHQPTSTGEGWKTGRVEGWLNEAYGGPNVVD